MEGFPFFLAVAIYCYEVNILNYTYHAMHIIVLLPEWCHSGSLKP